MAEKIKVLNLYAGIGGNRKLWNNCDVTAVEINQEIAEIYKEYYPEDKVIVGDAHDYLINHVQDGWDFIWASPPCQSHSRFNIYANHPPRYPDMKLYQEIIMLSNSWYNGKWVVENVIPYYTPLVNPTAKIDRHLFWANFKIGNIKLDKQVSIINQTGTSDRFGFNLKGVKMKSNKRQIIRNLIDPKLCEYIYNCARNIINNPIPEQQIINF